MVAESSGRGNPRPTCPMKLAIIDDAICVGCNRCVQVCPVDAIVGAAGYLHHVLTDDCIGCQLCLPPCPVDCIRMEPIQVSDKASRAVRAKARYQARQQRLAKQRYLPLTDHSVEKTKIKNDLTDLIQAYEQELS